MIKAGLVSGDFEDNTMTFEIEGDMILKAGKYTIYTDEENKNLSLSGVVKSFTAEEVLNVLGSSYELIDAKGFFEDIRTK